MTTTIYHNNRCRKSRETLELLQNEKELKVIYYLEDTPSTEELKELLKMLEMKPIELVRKGEAIWKEQFKGKELTDQDVLEAMVRYPKLMERPIVVKNGKAVIGRPPENVLGIL